MPGERSHTSWASDDDLVTGEAVALELPAASIGPRVLSGAIDLIVAFVLFYAVLIAWTATLSAMGEIDDDALVSAVALVALVVIVVGLPAAVETLTRGKTLGKLIVGLRTVRDDAGPITFRHAFTRAMVGVVEIYAFAGGPAVICALVTGKGKRLGDIAAGTYVIRERVRSTLPTPIPMPPHLADWATTADMTALPDSLAMSVRAFMVSTHQLAPGARAQVGQDLAARVLCYVAPPPPPGQHPEYVLAAVVADRRRRDLQRLARDAAIRASVVPPDPLG
ncbi:MAG TPA: RDD family protein [Candidatus Lustribacter sp.]|nr:RDD family protein [Candidatus Lustribacter sp.]